MIGQTISHYKILEKLGEGGMGVVYKAHDTILDRTVALKFLPHSVISDQAEKKRFYQEARAAAALTHPNIAIVHEIGEHGDQVFISMEYIEGETLRQEISGGQITLSHALDIAIHISEGLKAAHKKGIVHRDIKPENVMLAKESGIAKIMDFGLAKLGGGTRLTKSGSTLGTAAYMSPEQARGEDVDQRSDIFSLGVVLYEMLAGRLPFRGEHPAALIYSIMNEQPAPLTQYNEKVPSAIARIVMKALAKEPDERYEHIGDMLADLKTERRTLGYSDTAYTDDPMTLRAKPGLKTYLAAVLGTVIGVVLIIYFLFRPAKTIDSIAVLPFVDINADSSTEYLSDGITENLINSLTKLPNLRVVPRSTSFHYKGKDIEPRAVGEALNIHSLLTGRVIHKGDELNIQLDLIDIPTESQVWGAQYTMSLSNLAALQEEITREVSQRLQPRLGSTERVMMSRGQTTNAEALQLYLKGRFYWNKRTEPGLRNAIVHFQQAIEKDPGYALAYTGLADSYAVLAAFGFVAPDDAFPKAKAAVFKALELDSTLAEAHTTLAFILQRYEWKWGEAENEYLKAIQLKPSYATAFHWYGLLLSTMRRDSESVAACEHAVQLDPLSLPIAASLGVTYLDVGQLEKARLACSKAIEMDSGFTMAHIPLALIYLEKGMVAEGIHELEVNAGFPTSTPEDHAWLGYGYARVKKFRAARKVLAELQTRQQHQYVPPLFFALIYMGLDEKEETYKWLERAYELHDYYLGNLPRPVLSDLVSRDRRFRDIIQRIGLMIY
jgi:eukaryotic-like serine/threonine-protein kinase